MKFLTFFLTLVLPISAQSFDETSYAVDPAKILQIAVTAVKEKYPRISSSDLVFESGFSFLCATAQEEDNKLLYDIEFDECSARVKFRLASSVTTFVFLDSQGNCVAEPASPVIVHVYQDGSTWVISRTASKAERHIVECSSEDIIGNSAIQESELDNSKAFSFDPKKVLELAAAAVIEEYPEAGLKNLKHQNPLMLHCHPTRIVGEQNPLDVEFNPCNTALVTFLDTSTKVSFRFIDENGRCIVEEVSASVAVTVSANGTTEVGSRDRIRGAGGEVECTDEFFDAKKTISPLANATANDSALVGLNNTSASQ